VCQDCKDPDGYCDKKDDVDCDENDDCDTSICEICDIDSGNCDCICDNQVTGLTSTLSLTCTGEEITFTATTNPADQCGCIDWDPNEGPDGCDLTLSWEDPDEYTVRATSSCNVDSYAEKEVTIIQLTKIKAGAKESTKESAEAVGPDETLYFAMNGYNEEPDPPEYLPTRSVGLEAVFDDPPPAIPECFSWSPGDGDEDSVAFPTLPEETPGDLPEIEPDQGTLSPSFYENDFSLTTISATCGDKTRYMKIAVEGVDLSTINIEYDEEMTKTYNIFLNEDFDQQLPAADEPGHADCLLPDNDNSDDTLTGDDMSEIGEINFTAETHEDPGATVYFTSSSSIIKLYDSEKNKLDFGYNNKYDPNDLGSTLYVEGIAEGTTTLTATLTTGDEFTATDSILIKVIGLDFKAVNRLPSAEDPHEICYRDKLIILVNDNDSNANGESDLDDSTIPGGDPDLAMISLFKPNATEEDVPGNITVTFPGGVNVYRKSDKSIGPISSFSEPLSYFTDPNNPTYMHARVDFFLEGKTASSAILDQHVKVEMALDSGVKCEDEIHYTVIDINLDMEGVADEKETIPGGFIALNDDDDDNNHTADKDENGPIVASGQPDSNDEDNLIKITCKKVLPTTFTGHVTLRAGTGIKVWENATKGGTIITLPKQYNTPGDLPKELYVEGTSRSTSVRDNYVRLEYEIGGKIFKDEIKLTVIDVQTVDVDSTADSDSYKIASVLASNQVPDEHFITVKGITGNIALKATIVPNTAETRDLISWTNMTQDGSDKLKATKSRAASGKFPAKVRVNGKTAHSLANWVVWSSSNTLTFNTTPTIYATYTKIIVDVTSDFLFTILPSKLFTDNDRPQAISGSTSPVPGGSQTHVVSGNPLSGGVNSCWDESRQIRAKILNPHLYTKAQLPSVPGHLFDGQPAAVDIPEDYPTDDVIGNDDSHPGDEDNDPYNAPDKGILRGSDDPTTSMIHSTGSNNDTFERRYHFREFARLKLGNKWYRISSFVLWKAHYKYKRVSGQWTDNGSFGAANNSGW